MTSSVDLLINWLQLLRNFQDIITQTPVNFAQVKQQWQVIQNYLQGEIVSLNDCHFAGTKASAWQTWQTETHRYIRLLNTELLFWQSSKQVHTQNDRALNIEQRLQATINLTEQLMEQQ